MEGSIARRVEGSSWGGGARGEGWEVRLRQGRGQGEYEGGIVGVVGEGGEGRERREQ